MGELKTFGKPDNRFCRVAYCPECAKHNRPRTCKIGDDMEFLIQDVIWIWLGTQKRWAFINIKSAPRLKGYVPHLFEYLGATGDNIQYQKTCLVHDCGVITIRSGNIYYPAPKIMPRIEFMHIDDWKALMGFTDTGYKIAL